MTEQRVLDAAGQQQSLCSLRVTMADRPCLTPTRLVLDVPHLTAPGSEAGAGAVPVKLQSPSLNPLGGFILPLGGTAI